MILKEHKWDFGNTDNFIDQASEEQRMLSMKKHCMQEKQNVETNIFFKNVS